MKIRNIAAGFAAGAILTGAFAGTALAAETPTTNSNVSEPAPSSEAEKSNEPAAPSSEAEKPVAPSPEAEKPAEKTATVTVTATVEKQKSEGEAVDNKLTPASTTYAPPAWLKPVDNEAEIIAVIGKVGIAVTAIGTIVAALATLVGKVPGLKKMVRDMMPR